MFTRSHLRSKAISVCAKALVLQFLLTTSSYAFDEIITPYLSVRSVGMGGVILTTGLYDENFFNNPARITANPENRFTLLQMTPVEVSATTLSQISNITSNSSDPIAGVSQGAGNNIHSRLQLILPAYYLRAKDDRKWALGIGMILSGQVNANLRKSYNMDIGGIIDIGPAVTFGRKFLSDDSLSVGVTGHVTYRVATSPTYGLIDFVQGTPLSISAIAGQGAMYDFDFGSTYKVGNLGDFDVNVAGAIQNILGGGYSNLGFKPLSITATPLAQPRSVGFGGNFSRETWGYFSDSVLALEVRNIGNNTNGSLFRMIHLGTETHWKALAFRAGLNQGYYTLGFGIGFSHFTLDLASYGVEMGLNAGTLEDRRYTMNFGFHI